MSQYKIEQDIPIPTSSHWRGETGPKPKYPFRDLEVGESFFVPVKGGKEKVRLMRKNLNHRGWILSKDLGTHYTIRTYDDGVRVWRDK